LYYIAILNNLNNNNCGIITRNLKLGISRAEVVSVVAMRGKREYVSDGPKGFKEVAESKAAVLAETLV